MIRAETARKCARSFQLDGVPVDQSKIGFVDQCSRLEAVAGTFTDHAAPRDPVQLVVNEWNQPLEGPLVAFSPFKK